MMVQTRRDVVGLLGAGLLAGTDEPWPLEAFRKMTGIEVVHNYLNAKSEMLTKLRANLGTYDVVLIASARVKQATAESLLDPIDLRTIPNAAKLSTQLLQNATIPEDGETYSVT